MFYRYFFVIVGTEIRAISYDTAAMHVRSALLEHGRGCDFLFKKMQNVEKKKGGNKFAPHPLPHVGYHPPKRVYQMVHYTTRPLFHRVG